MTTRAEFLALYRTDDAGRIVQPGKFEGEMIYAPYFYECAMQGAEDETEYDGETPVSVFVVSADDRLQFPELGAAVIVKLYEDGQGFVRCFLS